MYYLVHFQRTRNLETAQWFWLRVSHEVAGKVLTGSESLTEAEACASKVARSRGQLVIGRRPQFLTT